MVVVTENNPTSYRACNSGRNWNNVWLPSMKHKTPAPTNIFLEVGRFELFSEELTYRSEGLDMIAEDLENR